VTQSYSLGVSDFSSCFGVVQVKRLKAASYTEDLVEEKKTNTTTGFPPPLHLDTIQQSTTSDNKNLQ